VFTPDAMGSYGLGIANLLPVRDGEAAGHYVARYISRELGTRRKVDRGARLVRYSQSWKRCVEGPFTWYDSRARRAKVRAEELAAKLWGSWGKMMRDVGPAWKFRLMRTLYCEPDKYFWIVWAAEMELECYSGPLFALDQAWADSDQRSAAYGAEWGWVKHWVAVREPASGSDARQGEAAAVSSQESCQVTLPVPVS